MSILHVRNVPQELYEQIQQMADAKHRSLSAQVVTLLEQAVKQEQARQAQAQTLAGIRRRRLSQTTNPAAPDSASLLREDRTR